MNGIVPTPQDVEGAGGLTVLGYVLRPVFLKDGRILLEHTSQVLRAAEAQSLPEYRKNAQGQMQQNQELRKSNRHLLVKVLHPMHDLALENSFRVRTQRRLTAVALAIRWYAVEHGGAMPKSLEELVPKYLPAVPGDAMGEGRKIGYVAEESRPRIYSVGPNGTDERGSDAPVRKNAVSGGTWQMEDVVVDLKRRPREVEEK